MPKMKTTISLSILLFLALFTNNLCGQELLHLPYGTTPTIDGTFAPNEWDDADSVHIDIIGNTKRVKVLFKHDSVHLHVAFLRNLESVNARYPEIMIDVNNAKSALWQADDWWFHVSATDCEYKGHHSNYDSCAIVRPNWTAAGNFAMGPPVTDTVEIQIPFQTIGLVPLLQSTFGLSFEVTNTFSAWDHWPRSAQLNLPYTWANATFDPPPTTSVLERAKVSEFKLYPNPTVGSFTLDLKHSDLVGGLELTVMNILGDVVHVENLTQTSEGIKKQFDLDVPPGMYLVRLKSGSRERVQKLVVHKM